MSERTVWGINITQRGDCYAASLPFRQIECEGRTEFEAVGGLMAAYADLARKGAVDPANPDKVGAPPIQHALNVLTEQLLFEVKRRYDGYLENVVVEGPSTWKEESYTRDPEFDRHNAVIAGIATSIAALARVKEL